jgi:hypothetical protein
MKPDYLWRCDCGSGHFLGLRWDENQAELEGYFAIEGDFSSSWRSRLGQAWRIIRNGHEGSRVGLILDYGDAEDVAARLLQFSASARKEMYGK